jgi:ribonuclease HII
VTSGSARARSPASLERADPGAICVGIDENGLGPRLGPLVVTAVVARATGDKAKRVIEKGPKGALARHIGDSKKLVSFGDSVLGEAWARSFSTGGPASPDALVDSLSIDPRATLTRPCPEAHQGQCWDVGGEAFAADEGLVRALGKDRAGLAKRGVEILGVHTAIVCTERLNDALARGLSRFQVDLHAMERLILHARERYGAELDVTCGKVGGYNSYPAAFGPLSGWLVSTLTEGRARSEYRVLQVGKIAFVRDADASHLLVALASLVGKWVRDLMTRRVTRYHRAHDPTLPEASGYHDPVTARFVDASSLARRQREVPDICFERGSLGRGEEDEATSSPRRATP